jgi:hypothetical protein
MLEGFLADTAEDGSVEGLAVLGAEQGGNKGASRSAGGSKIFAYQQSLEER